MNTDLYGFRVRMTEVCDLKEPGFLSVNPGSRPFVGVNLGLFTQNPKNLEGQYINDQERVEPWDAYYDEYGREKGRTDYNAGNKAASIPDTHHHTKEYNAQFPNGRSTGDHIEGVYKP